MKKLLAVMIVALLPFGAQAQTQPVAAPAPAESGATVGGVLTVAVLVVGGLVAADYLSGGFLSAPIAARTGWAFPWVASAAAGATAAPVAAAPAAAAVTAPASAIPAAAIVRPWYQIW